MCCPVSDVMLKILKFIWGIKLFRCNNCLYIIPQFGLTVCSLCVVINAVEIYFLLC